MRRWFVQSARVIRLFVAGVCLLSAFCSGRAVPLFVVLVPLFVCLLFLTAALLKKDGWALITSRVVFGVFCFLNRSVCFVNLCFVFQI
jgi:hypothetical protein